MFIITLPAQRLIPFDWKKGFDVPYLRHILFYCLVMTRNYIRNHFADIKKYADIIEKRFDDTWFTKETALEENIKNLELCKQNNCCYILIDDRYDVDIEINRPETFSVVP